MANLVPSRELVSKAAYQLPLLPASGGREVPSGQEKDIPGGRNSRVWCCYAHYPQLGIYGKLHLGVCQLSDLCAKLTWIQTPRLPDRRGCWNSLLAAVIQGGRHILASFPGFPQAPAWQGTDRHFSPLFPVLALRQRLLSSIQMLPLTSHGQKSGHTWHFLPNEILVQRVSCFCLWLKICSCNLHNSIINKKWGQQSNVQPYLSLDALSVSSSLSSLLVKWVDSLLPIGNHALKCVCVCARSCACMRTHGLLTCMWAIPLSPECDKVWAKRRRKGDFWGDADIWVAKESW